MLCATARAKTKTSERFHFAGLVALVVLLYLKASSVALAYFPSIFLTCCQTLYLLHLLLDLSLHGAFSYSVSLWILILHLTMFRDIFPQLSSSVLVPLDFLHWMLRPNPALYSQPQSLSLTLLLTSFACFTNPLALQ